MLNYITILTVCLHALKVVSVESNSSILERLHNYELLTADKVNNNDESLPYDES